MISRKYLLSLLSILASTSMVLTACGDETLQCGSGTVEKSGKCVAETPEEDPLECGAGTELDADGKKCVATEQTDKIQCGTGTELDATGQNCVPIPGPAPIKCGDGTVLENGTCIAEVSCNDDQTAVGGFCLSPAEALAASDSAQNIDENFELALPIEGEHFIFTGTIDAPAEVDEELVQNIDSFTFEGEAGQWFEITLQSLGLPAPAFKIEAIIGEDEAPFTYERFSPFGAEAVARHIMLPIDATYKVTILPEQAITHTGPFGAESWKYVGTLKQLETPDTTDIELISNDEDAKELSGTFTVLPLNLYELQTADGANTIQLTIDQADENVRASVLVFSDLNTLLQSYDHVQPGQVIELAASNAPTYVLVDWIQVDGPAQNYNILARSVGTRVPLKLDARSSQTLAGFSAPENTIIKLSLAGTSVYPIALSILDADGELIGKVRDVKAGEDHTTIDVVNYVFYSAGGEFSVFADNDSDIDHDTELLIELIKPTPVGDLTSEAPLHAEKALQARTFNFFLVESVEEFTILNFSQLNTQMFYESLITLTLHETNGNIALDDELLISSDEDGWGAPILLTHYMNGGGPFVVQIENFEFDEFDPFTLTIDATSTTLIETADPAGLRSGESIEHIHTQKLAAGAQHWLRLLVDEPIELTGLLTALPPGDVDIKGFTSDFRLFLASERDGDETFDVRIPPGVYLLAVSAFATADDGYTLTGTTTQAYPTINATDSQSSFENAVEISEIPARINGSAAQSLTGVHQFWKFTATENTTFSLDMTHLGGASGMHVIVYNEDETTEHARTVEPLGITPTDDNRRANLQFPVIAGETYFLRIGGDAASGASTFTYTIKITDLNS